MDNSVINKKKAFWDTHKPSKRRIIQLYSALLYNAHLRGFAEGRIFAGNTKAVCVPGLNCYSCPGATFACPLGALQNALGSLNKNVGFYIFGIIMLYGALLGRTICGWLCPFGLIQEFLHMIPTVKLKKSRFTRALSYLKYLIIVVFVIVIPVYYGIFKDIPVPGFCKYICPAGTLEGAIALLPQNPSWKSMLGSIFTQKIIIMVIVILACIFCYRSFCRFLCPLGAIYGIFDKLAVMGVKVDESRCNHCGACVKSCKMDIKQVGDHECIHCAQCVAVCKQGAISMKVDKTSKKICWSIAVIALAAVLIWANFLDPSLKASDSTAFTGYEVGNSLQDFEAKCLDGSTFKLKETRGKVVFINLWATYCGPCVKELPYFDELYHEHEGDIAMLAVHANLTTEDVEAYLADKGWDIPIAIDDDNETIFGIVGGSFALPQTIVLNRNGEVIYNQVGSVTPELLESLYEKAAE